MNKTIVLLLASLLGTVCLDVSNRQLAFGQTATAPPALEVGQAAPPLSLRDLLQGPGVASADLSKLRGKVVVLEFWATWCAPCVAMIPHFNELSSKLPKNQVQFIAVDREPKEVQERFLKANPMKAWIAVDDGRTGFRYQVRSIPKTVIIDKQGNIISISHPHSVDVENIQNIIAGKPSGIKQIVVRRGTNLD